MTATMKENFWLRSIGPLINDDGTVPESLAYEVYVGSSKIGVVESPLIGLWSWRHHSMTQSKSVCITRGEAIARLIRFDRSF